MNLIRVALTIRSLGCEFQSVQYFKDQTEAKKFAIEAAEDRDVVAVLIDGATPTSIEALQPANPGTPSLAMIRLAASSGPLPVVSEDIWRKAGLWNLMFWAPAPGELMCTASLPHDRHHDYSFTLSI